MKFINTISMAIAALLFLMFSLMQNVNAEVSSATIRGVVEDAQGKELTISAISINNGKQVTVTLSDDGSYVIKGLRPGKYKIKLGDNEPFDDHVNVLVGQTAEFNVAAIENDELEEVVVYGVTANSISASQAATNITPEQIARLPQNQRNFLSSADLAPGAVVESNPADGSVSVRSGAQQASAINVFIDGVSQKDNVLKSGISGQDSSRGNPFPLAAIEQYRIISSNYKAEFQHLSGAAITAVTKSGTNEFKGGVFFDYTDSDLRTKRPLEEESGMKAEDQQQQYGLWSSGPIVKDTLFYVFTYEKKNNEDVREVTVPTEFSHLIDNYPQFLQTSIEQNVGPTTAKFEEDLYFLKLDWNIDDRNDLEFSVKYRDESEITNIGGINTIGYGSEKLNDDTRVKLAHHFRSGNLLNNLIFTYEDTAFNPKPRLDQPGLRFQVGAEDAIVGEVINLGGGADFQLKGQQGWGLQNDLTISNLEWFGDHVVKMGVSYKEIELTAIEQNSLNPQFFFALDSVGIATDDTTTLLPAIPYKVEFGRERAGANSRSTSDNTQIGAYIQDDWLIGKRLEINIGVRYDLEQAPQYEDFVTSPDVVAALRGWDNISATDYDVENYISTGSERTSFDGTLAPRIGFSYDLSKNGDYVLFGGAGRSYNRIRYDHLQLETTKDSFPRRTVYFNGNHRQPCNDPCVDWQDDFLSTDGISSLTATEGAKEVFLLNNDLDTPYSDQFSLGINAFYGDWETELGVRYVESKNGFHWAIGNRRENGFFFDQEVPRRDAAGNIITDGSGQPLVRPATWGIPWEDDIPGDEYSHLLIGRNGLESELTAVHLKATKPHDNGWGMTFTYTWSDATENREFGEAFALDYPTLDGYGNQPSAGVSDHSVVATFTYDLPWQIHFSSKLTLRSAAPFYGLNCTQGWEDCFYDQGYIEEESFIVGDWAFRQLDVAFSKNFSLKNYGGYYIRMDILNLLDETNFGDDTTGVFKGVDNWFGSPGTPNPNVGQTNGVLAGPTRTIKLSAGYNF